MSLTDLPRRATACPGWEWLPGMRATRPDGSFPMRMVEPGCWAHEGEHGHRIQAATGILPDDIPDLTDDATVGALLKLVRLAWGLPDLGVAGGAGGVWRFYARALPDALLFLTAESEAELLVVALERAPVTR